MTEKLAARRAAPQAREASSPAYARAARPPAPPAAKGRARTESLLNVFEYEPLERVDAIKRGIPAEVVLELADRMGITKERLFAMLGLPRATVDRKLREKKDLSRDESSRVLGAAHLVGQVQAMVEESGTPQGFNAAAWVADWLDRAVPALADRRPAELMDTAEGQAIVAKLLERAQTAAYS
jgi:putative toxin-antitoxin system antitoxin component (TIGR02293 family)